ncbi:MAG: lysophospholipid acyltransferase family protein [Candidatus Aminicenantales bacterium]
MAEAQRAAENALAGGLIRLALWLSRPSRLALGGLIGRLLYHADRKHRNTALRNLQTAFGARVSLSRQKRIAIAAFEHFGAAFLDLVGAAKEHPRAIANRISVKGLAFIQEALGEGKGALLFSAHFGNWEMAPAFLSQVGRLNVVARPLDNPHLERRLQAIRAALGSRVISKHRAARQVLRALRANDMVAILIDQNVLRSQAVFVDFFGKPAATTPSLATFHLRSRAPLIPVFCYPADNRGYRLDILPPVTVSLSGDEHADVLKITQACTKIIQHRIQEDPEYWFWFHDRWKTRPPGEKT